MYIDIEKVNNFIDYLNDKINLTNKKINELWDNRKNDTYDELRDLERKLELLIHKTDQLKSYLDKLVVISSLTNYNEMEEVI